MNLFTGFTRLKDRISASKLARNTFFMSAGNGVRLVLQAIYFVLIARALGPSQYGAFIGAVALIGIAAPFANLGFGGILIKHTSRDHNRFPESWGNALFMTAVGSVLMLVVVLVAAHFILGGKISLALVVLVAVADLFLFPLVTLAGQAFIGFENLAGTARTLVVLSVSRTFSALLLAIIVNRPTATTWAALYLLSSGIAAAYALIAVIRQLGRPRLALRRIRPDLAEGFYFAIGLSSQTVYNDIDKTMLVRLSELSAAGIYGTAYRLVDVTFQPVSALLYASFAKFFKAGENGIEGSVKIARRLLPYAVAYGGAAALALFLLGPVLPYVLGKDFSESAAALRWLALLAVIRPVHYMAANSLTGAGFQGVRAATQIVVAGVNIGLNLWLIPLYSWRGAAWSSLTADGLLAVAFWSAAVLVRRNGSHSVPIKAGVRIQPS